VGLQIVDGPDHVAAAREHFRSPIWQHKAATMLLRELGRTNARRVRGLKDCRDLAAVARFLDQAARLEPGPILDRVESLCGPDAVDLVQDVTERFVARMTGIDSLKSVAQALRIAGVWSCAISGALDTCACADDLARQMKQAIRGDLLSGPEP